MGNPLVPHPSSLKLYILLVEDEDENKTALRWICLGIYGNRCRARRNSFDLRRDSAYGDFATIPATMGLAFACRTRSAAPQVTGSHCRKISTSLRMTRRGKADFLFAPYARHRFLQNKKDICISKDTYVLILFLTATNIR